MADGGAFLEGLDVDAYAAKYGGRNRVERLLFVAARCPALRADARRVLLHELRDGLDMRLFLEVAEAAQQDGGLPEGVEVDMAHVETVKRSAAQQHERMERELNSYKSTMIKESIRVRSRPWRLVTRKELN
jgi:COP9 signalosome complex subunit 1